MTRDKLIPAVDEVRLNTRPITRDEAHAAALTVCAHATDTADARGLLEALRLVTYHGHNAVDRESKPPVPAVRVGYLDGGAA